MKTPQSLLDDLIDRAKYENGRLEREKQMNHTPGPWKWDETEIDDIGLYYRRTLKSSLQGNGAVLFHRAQWDIYREDANLIAAAPELLEALKVCQIHIFMHEGS